MPAFGPGADRKPYIGDLVSLQVNREQYDIPRSVLDVLIFGLAVKSDLRRPAFESFEGHLKAHKEHQTFCGFFLERLSEIQEKEVESGGGEKEEGRWLVMYQANKK